MVLLRRKAFDFGFTHANDTESSVFEIESNEQVMPTYSNKSLIDIYHARKLTHKGIVKENIPLFYHINCYSRNLIKTHKYNISLIFILRLIFSIMIH